MAGTYRSAGVDLDAADEVVDRIGDTVKATWGANVRGGFGGFAAGLDLPPGYTNPVLMMSTDGVGTKLDLARRADRFDGVGFDLVAMCVDDLAAAGATPIAFTDYIAVGAIVPEQIAAVVASIAAACAEAGAALLGGETAEHPGTMPADGIDIAGTALGICERDATVTGADITPDDVVIGLPSPNLRSNGFSLVRAVLGDVDVHSPFPGADATFADVLLEPSVIYAPAINAITADGGVTGLAHVTGGGLAGNVTRVLPDGASVVVDPTTWTVPPVFDLIAERGDVALAEMRRVFNMGIGFVVIASHDLADDICGRLADFGHDARPIGEVVEGDQTVEFR